MEEEEYLLLPEDENPFLPEEEDLLLEEENLLSLKEDEEEKNLLPGEQDPLPLVKKIFTDLHESCAHSLIDNQWLIDNR